MSECPICRVTHTVLVPTIHSNGTSAGELNKQLSAAVDAVRAASRALCDAAPNGRDYYLQPNGQRSQAQHEARLSKLNAVLSELQQQWDHVQEAINLDAERKARR